jgi:oligosaccharide repeat unit polymerase
MLGNIGLLALVVGAYFISRKRYDDVFTPLFIYVSVWCACLLLFRLRLINYDELEFGTTLLISVSGIVFVLGCLAVGKPRRRVEAKFNISLPRLERAIWVLIGLSLAGLFFYLLRVVQSFGISTYIRDPSVLRTDWEDLGHMGPLLLLLSAIYPLFICSVIHLLESKKLRSFTLIGLSLPAIQGYLTVSRNALAVPIISGVFVWFYYRGWRSFSRKIISRGALALLFIGVYFVGIGFWYGKLASSANYSYYKLEDINVTSQVALQFVDPYIYTTVNFPTLQQALGDVHGRTWGTRTFFPVAQVLYTLGLLHDRPEFANMQFYNVPIPSNSATYLLSIYEDFGMAGVVIYPFLLGYIGTKVYLNMRSHPTIFSIGNTAVLMAVIIYSIFIELGSMFQVWYCVGALLIVSRRCIVKHRAIAVIGKTNEPIIGAV